MIPPGDENSNITRGDVKDDGTDEEDGGGGYIAWVIIGIIIVFLAVCGFASYKIYMAKRGPSSYKVQDLSPRNIAGKGGALNKKKEPVSKPKKEKDPNAKKERQRQP